MSKLETPMTLRYWESVGGTLIEEFVMVPAGPNQGVRRADGLILPEGKTERLAPRSAIDISNKDVIVVQTKNSRLGMSLIGQALLSAELLRRYHSPRSVRSVALCTKGDEVLEQLLGAYPGVELVVMKPGGTPDPQKSQTRVTAQSLAVSDLYEFILANTQDEGGVLICRASIMAELQRLGIEDRQQTRIRLVKELEKQGLIKRPNPRSRVLVVTPTPEARRAVKRLEHERFIDRMSAGDEPGGVIITKAPNLPGFAPPLSADQAATKRRVARLSRYLSNNVLTKDHRFVCSSKRDCKSSIAAGCSFQEPFLSYVGSHYDLARDGKPVRIVVVGQEVGKAKRKNATMEDRAKPIRASAYEKRLLKEGSHPRRNPHMRGTTLALRTILGVPGWDHATEFLDFDGKSVHLFDCMALVNRLLCSAHVTGTSNGKSSTTMLMNCKRHFRRTLEILEPTIVVLQGVRMWKWSQEVLVPVRKRGQNLFECDLSGSKVMVAALTHPSARGEHRWDSPASPYFKSVVRPTLKRAAKGTGR